MGTVSHWKTDAGGEFFIVERDGLFYPFSSKLIAERCLKRESMEHFVGWEKVPKEFKRVDD